MARPPIPLDKMEFKVEVISVTAPQVATTEDLSGTNLYFEPSRRAAKVGATIDGRAFDLLEIGHVPGSEREYEEEQSDMSSEDALDLTDCPDDDLQAAAAGTSPPTAKATAEAEAAKKPTAPPAATAVFRLASPLTVVTPCDDSPGSSDSSDEDVALGGGSGTSADLSDDIDRAVHLSMLKSIRDTTVLSSHSKKQTMLGINRTRNTTLSMDSAEEGSQDLDFQDLLNFQV